MDNLDFLDAGLPAEHNDNDVSHEISHFLEFCKNTNKRPEQLTDRELNLFYKEQTKQ